MMKLSCKDIDSSLNCHFEATGDTAAEVSKKMMTHMKSAHPEKAKGMTDDEMMEMFEEKVHS